MANNYIAKIRAELDSGSLQEQINKIVKSSGTIKIKVEADGDISRFIKDISKKVESAGNVSIKPKVDVSDIDSSMGTLSKTITRIVDESTQSIENIFKSVGDGFDRTISQVDGETKRITQDYESYTKRALAEEQKMQEALASTLKKRREEEEKIQRAQASAINKSQEESYRESLKIQEALVEMIEKRKKEEANLQREQNSAINKSQEEIYKKINLELEKASSLMNKLNESTAERAQLEERLKTLSVSSINESTLEDSKKLTSDIAERISFEKQEREIAKSISSELEKSSSVISKMKEGTEGRLLLERELSRISSSDINEDTLRRAKEFTKWTEERLAREKEETSTSEKINKELDKSLSYIVKMQEGTEERLALEKKLYDISSSSTSKESLSAAERLTAEAKEQLSAEKSRISIQERINGKLSEASSYISKMTEGTQERLALEKKLDEISSGGTTQENLNKAKQLTMEAREQLSVEKSIISVDQKINAELEKTSSYISKMKEGTSERAALEKKLSDLSGAETDEKTLTRAKQLTAEAKEKLEIEKKELSVQEQIDNKIKEIKTRMEAVKISSSQRLEIEKKIEDAMAMENSKDRLSALKNINTEITAMGKNAMGLGAMLQTAYEKFANKLRLCTEMCIEKQCVYAGKS